MSSTVEKSRIPTLDFIRGYLVFMMVIYHFFWDLGYFGYINFSYITTGIGLLIAQCIGTSFIFLSGISISLLFSSNSFNGHVFLIKFIKISGISATISLVTWLIDPQSFIYFGILHLLSLCYLLAYFILCMRSKVLVHIFLATLFLIWILGLKFDVHAFWSWVGIAKEIPSSNDFYPLIPWSIFFFIGLLSSNYVLGKIRALKIRSWNTHTDNMGLNLKIALLAGRKSLLIYICHQPLFFALFLSFNALWS